MFFHHGHHNTFGHSLRTFGHVINHDIHAAESFLEKKALPLVSQIERASDIVLTVGDGLALATGNPELIPLIEGARAGIKAEKQARKAIQAGIQVHRGVDRLVESKGRDGYDRLIKGSVELSKNNLLVGKSN